MNSNHAITKDDDNMHKCNEWMMYRSVLDRAPIGIAIFRLDDLNDDRTMRIIYINQIIANLIGIASTNVIGKTLDELFPSLREQGIPQTYAHVIRSDEGLEREIVSNNEHLPTATYLMRMIPIPDQSIAVIYEDITDLKNAEHKLKQMNAELEQRVAKSVTRLNLAQRTMQRLIDNAPSHIYAKDLEGRFLMVNQHTSALIGMKPEDVLGKLDSELFPSEAVTVWRNQEREIIESGMAITRDEQLISDDGTRHFFSMLIPLHDEKGRIYGIGGISTDITERKRQENELRAFKAIADNAVDGISMVDLQGNILYINPTIKKLFGRDTIPLGSPITDLYPLEMQEQVRQTIIPTVLASNAWRDEIELPRPDGSTWIAQRNVFLVRDEQGDPIGLANFLRDVTEQRQQELERSSFQQQLIEAQRNALRELSTPLIPISNDVLIMPLIGTIDSARAQMVMETLLEGVARQQARLVILDITGVMVVDTQVAQTFIQAAQAVRLLGAQVMLTGIQPQIAQTLVHLGVDLSGIITRGSLQSGIEAALRGSQGLHF